MTEPSSIDQLCDLAALIDATLGQAEAEIDAVRGVERVNQANPFWYVRIEGDSKTNFSAEFTLGQRTLICESYFMPEPEENREQVFEHLLVRNRAMHPLQFAVGSSQRPGGGEPAIYLRAQVDNRDVNADTVERLLAAVYQYTEQFFVPAMRLGYESRFTD